jgi:hypothetical protein
MADRKLSREQRMEVFKALVEAQDGEVGVVRSRKEVAQRFGLSDRQLKQVEQEGVDGDWPPLG